MFFKHIQIYIIILTSIIVFSACKGFQKVLKSSDYELKYTTALEYYNKQDYYRALQLLEELVPITRGSARGQEVYFYYAYCYYGQENYIMAGYHFKNFAKTYPNGTHTEECEFLTAYCFYRDSPGPSLDQTNTFRAINALQLFINKYPDSERLEECNELIDKLRDKLEIKSFEEAKLYYELSDYKAAVVSLKNALIDYPDTQYREEMLYLIVKSSYLLAENSIESKKKERYQSTIKEYYAFVDEFPETEYKKSVVRYYDDSIKNVKN